MPDRDSGYNFIRLWKMTYPGSGRVFPRYLDKVCTEFLAQLRGNVSRPVSFMINLYVTLISVSKKTPFF